MLDLVIADRKANPTEKNDLLNRMLNGKDPKTGKTLSDENIKNNVRASHLSLGAASLRVLIYLDTSC